jgi:hypothetical protein
MCDAFTMMRSTYFSLASLNESLVSEFLPAIKRFYQTDWFRSQTASWNSRYRPEFSEVLTKRGYGFAFNMLAEAELFTDK